MAKSASDPAVDSVEHLLDLFLYAPIGLVSKGAEALPEFAKRGRTQATNARVVGQFALGATNAKVRASLTDAEQHLHAFLKIVADAASPARSSASASESEASDESHVSSESEDSASVDAVIREYDSLTAAQIVPLLADLSQEQLELLDAYEQSHRARKTILNRLRQLRK